MQLKLLNGYPDLVGKRSIFAGYGNGPASYLQAGDPLYIPQYGFYVDIAFPARSVSGAYDIVPKPSSFGPRATWNLFWSGVAGAVASVTQNAAGTGMTPGTYIVNATTGTAQISVVVASATTLGAITVLNAGNGYPSAPSFLLTAAGGTPATLTATLTVAGPVAASTNLSGETVQLGGFGGVY